MNARPYDSERDRAAVLRLWREIGWAKPEQESHLLMIECGRGFVVEVAGEAECIVTTTMGDVQYLDEKLPLSCVTGVATSLVARKLGLAQRVTAQAVAQAVVDGAIVSGLGMFEQGFYNRLGYGTGSYEHQAVIEPWRLRIDREARVPGRFTKEDYEAAHRARLARLRHHGSVSITSSLSTRFDMEVTYNGFGLGYLDDDGALGHHMWFGVRDNIEEGPYRVKWMTWRNADEFLELMALIRNFGDQVHAVRLHEPASIQLQDLIRKPITAKRIARASDFDAFHDTLAFWQMRICDLSACLARTKISATDSVRFNLAISDPIESLLDDESQWKGVGGEYIVELGQSSSAERGRDDALPTLRASVNAFTRLWLGVRPATGLAITDDLDGPTDLLDELDHVLRLPRPGNDWEY